MSTLVDRTLEPLDEIRRGLIRVVLRVPLLRAVLIRRATRVPWLLSLHAVGALTIALLAPALSLVLAPLLFGVPHLAADVRYLVLRRALPRGLWLVLASGGLAILALRLFQKPLWLRADSLVVEHALGSCQLLAGALFGAALSRSRVRSALTLVAACALSSLALLSPELFRLGLVHAHNLVAIVLWAMLFRRATLRTAWPPLALIALATVALLSGMGLQFSLRHGLISLWGMHLFEAADQLAPSIAGDLGLSLTISYAFLQSIHYAIWLLAIPQDDARAEGSPNFRMKARALVHDFGRIGCSILAALVCVMTIASVISPIRARFTYLTLATFHAWLELAVLAFFLPQRGPQLALPGTSATCERE